MSQFKPSAVQTPPPARPPKKPAKAPKSNPAESKDTVASDSSDEPVDETFEAALGNNTRKFALTCSLIFIFLRFSFLHEFLAARLHFDTHILLAFGFLSYLVALLSGTAQTAFSDRSTWFWLGFGALMCMATVTSIWQGGSFAIVFPYLRTTLPFILLIPAVVFSTADLKKFVNVIGLAGVTVILLGATSGDFRSGRLAMDTSSGSIGDSNDYAAHILLVLPAIAFLTFSKGRNLAVKIIGGVIMSLGLFQVLSTGSRGGLVSLIATMLYVLKVSSLRVRLGILLAIPLIVVLAIPFLPSESAVRLEGFFKKDTGESEAIASTQARTALLMESLRATESHPLLGVGPGEFMDFQGKMARDRGEQGMWHQSHNGYTQISSECGIPAAILYICAMISAFLSLLKGTKAKSEQIRSLSRVFIIMLVSFSICLIFLSQAYSFTLVVISAVSVVIVRLLKQPENRVEELVGASVG